jgi:hypothetical protein
MVKMMIWGNLTYHSNVGWGYSVAVRAEGRTGEEMMRKAEGFARLTHTHTQPHLG